MAFSANGGQLFFHHIHCVEERIKWVGFPLVFPQFLARQKFFCGFFDGRRIEFFLADEDFGDFRRRGRCIWRRFLHVFLRICSRRGGGYIHQIVFRRRIARCAGCGWLGRCASNALLAGRSRAGRYIFWRLPGGDGGWPLVAVFHIAAHVGEGFQPFFVLALEFVIIHALFIVRIVCHRNDRPSYSI